MPRFVAMMNAEAQRLGLRDSHYARADGLDAPGAHSSARDVTRLARIVMRSPVVRSIVRRRTAELPRGRVLHTWNDLLGDVSRGDRRQDWPHLRRRVVAGRGGARAGVTIYATILGSPGRGQRNADLERLLAWGLAQYRAVSLVHERRAYATARCRTGRGRRARRRGRLRQGGPHRQAARRERRAAAVAALPIRKAQRLGTVQLSAGGNVIARRPLVAARAVSRPGLAGRIRGPRAAPRTILTWLT